MASETEAMDLTRQGYIQPGPAAVVYPGGANNVSTTIRGIAANYATTTIAYGVGGNKFYRMSPVSATVPHTISGSSGTVYAWDVARYKGNFYYSWGADDGLYLRTIGKYNGGSTWDDTWWTGTMSASALQTLPDNPYGPKHPIEVGANDVLYFGNDRYVGSYDGSTAQDKALDLPVGHHVEDLAWMGDRLYVTTNYSYYGQPLSSIYIWDGTTDSWEAEVPIPGTAGANYVLNGVLYQFYYDRNGTNKLARLEGARLVDLTGYGGSEPPEFYQVTDWRNFLVWVPGEDSDDIFAWGSSGNGDPARLFHFADAGASGTGKAGGISSVLESPGIMVANNDQLYYLDTYNQTNYATTGNWKSMLFDITSDEIHGGKISHIRFNFEKLQSGAALNWSLVNNQGRTLYSDTISYAKATANNEQHTLTTALYSLNGLVAENFRVELDYSSGSSTAPVRVMNIKVYGTG